MMMMNSALQTTSTALLISVSLGLAACQSEVPLGDGLSRAQGGPCVQGQLTAFAATPDFSALTLDGESAYWLQHGEGPVDAQTLVLLRIPESGGTPETLASGIDDGSFLIDGDHVTWSQDSYDPLSHALVSQSLFSMPKAGGLPAQVATTTTGWGSFAAVDAERFYFIGAPPADSAKVLSMPRSGGPLTVIADMLVPGAPPDETNLDYDSISGLLADDQNLYWSYEGQVLALAKTGGQPVVLASGPNVITVVQDVERLYWIDVHDDLFSVAKSGGPVTTLGQALPARGDLVTDGVCLYMITVGTGATSLMAMPNAGGAPVVVADIPFGPNTGMWTAVDATGFYLTDSEDGTALKLAR
jgi:hypothetical protein